MRILHIPHCYPPAIGGTEYYLQQISERLAKSGEEVTVFTSNGLNYRGFNTLGAELLPADEKIINDVKVKRFAVQPIYSFSIGAIAAISWTLRLPYNDILRTLQNGPILKGFMRTLMAIETDIILASAFPAFTMLQVFEAAKKRRIPVVLFPALHPDDKWGYDRKIFYKILKECEAVIANSSFEKDYLTAKGIPAEKINVIGCGVDPADFKNADGNRIRKQFNLGDSPIVLFVGAKTKRKGLQHLIDAMDLVWGKFPKAKLMLAGPSGDMLIKKSLNIISIDSFPEDKKPDLYAACDVLVQPSSHESFGIVFLEAWICGKPVIGCRRGAVSAIIEDQKDGLLFEPGNRKELAEKILSLLSDKNLAGRLGKNGKEKVLNNFTWDIVTDKIRSLYRELVK